MSEKPQKTRGDKQEDLLEQIITQGLNQTKASAQVKEETPTDETPPAPKQEKVDEAVPLAEKKHRRHTVYLYLLILFGAAFLMLLLAYFVQQRSNENAMERFRSIDELLEDNRTLREEIAELEGRLTESRDQYDELERQYNQLTELNNRLSESLDEATDSQRDALYRLYLWEVFWDLDQYYQAKDYESCIAPIYILQTAQTDWPPSEDVAARESEIFDLLILRGYLDRDYKSHLEDYADLINAYGNVQIPSYVSRETSENPPAYSDQT